MDRRRDARQQPDFATRAIHHAYDPADHHGAVAPPVYFTSTYAFPSVAENEEAAARGGVLYAREYNPTTAILEARLASLEGAEACLAVATGMAAIGTLMLSLLSRGDEVVVNRTLYSNTMALTETGLPRFGIKVIPVDLADPTSLDVAITPRTWRNRGDGHFSRTTPHPAIVSWRARSGQDNHCVAA